MSKKEKEKGTRKKKPYLFTLKDIDTDRIEQKYGIVIIKSKEKTNITNIIDLKSDFSILRTVSFLDESKKVRNCDVSMIDYLKNEELIQCEYNCFWCRHSFDTKPVGCPIRYIAPQATKEYYSEISKDTYVIKENVTSLKQKKIKEKGDKCITVKEKGYYQTDGIFCSFPCVMAYINMNKKDSLYIHSKYLLTKMYNDIFELDVESISPAPHWRQLIEYGGNMNIDEFRSNFNRVDYDYHGITYPKFRSIGHLYEKKLKF